MIDGMLRRCWMMNLDNSNLQRRDSKSDGMKTNRNIRGRYSKLLREQRSKSLTITRRYRCLSEESYD